MKKQFFCRLTEICFSCAAFHSKCEDVIPFACRFGIPPAAPAGLRVKNVAKPPRIFVIKCCFKFSIILLYYSANFLSAGSREILKHKAIFYGNETKRLFSVIVDGRAKNIRM